MELDSKVYIAGHTGLVGSAVMRILKASGYRNLVTASHEELDLTRQLEVERFFRENKPEYVFLCAARVGGIKANLDYPANFIYNNLVIQTNVIHTAYFYKVKKLLFLGSSCIYPKDAHQPIKEESFMSGPLEFTNESYAIAKIAGIRMCQAYNKQYKTNFISAMPCNLYGPGDNFNPETSHVLPALINSFHQAKMFKFPSVEVWGTGMPLREFLYVDDLAEACLYLMKNYNGDSPVNIGTGVDISIEELAVIIKDIIGYDGDIRFNPAMPDGVYRKILDVSKINNMGWKARIGLKEGIRKTYQWLLSSDQQ